MNVKIKYFYILFNREYTREGIMFFTFKHTTEAPIVSAMEEMPVYTQNLEVRMHNLNPGCGVAPSTETSVP